METHLWCLLRKLWDRVILSTTKPGTVSLKYATRWCTIMIIQFRFNLKIRIWQYYIIMMSTIILNIFINAEEITDDTFSLKLNEIPHTSINMNNFLHSSFFLLSKRLFQTMVLNLEFANCFPEFLVVTAPSLLYLLQILRKKVLRNEICCWLNFRNQWNPIECFF